MEARQLEQLCAQFYSENHNDQKLAHEALFGLVSDPQHVGQFLAVLAQSQDPQALLFAANALVKLFTTFWTSINESQKTETRTFLLSYLFQRGKSLIASAPVTLNALVRFLARIVKLQWLESPANQNICEQVKPFLSASTAEWIVGILIYLELTNDMAPQAGLALARARRQAFSFRDVALPTIFTTAVDTLQQFRSGTFTLSSPAEDTRLLHTVLQLSLACLTFDFMGTFPDETNDDKADPLMIPTSWTIVKDSKLPTLYFDIYKSCCVEKPDTLKLECSRVCLEALAQVSSLRRSYFTKSEDRRSHLTELLTVSQAILDEGLGIRTDDLCYHHFCRFLGKINAAIPLSELKSSMMAEGTTPREHLATTYFGSTGMLSRFGRAGLSSDILLSEVSNPRAWTARDDGLLNWLKKVYEFTIESLDKWTYMPSSKHYLIGFWVCLVPALLQRSQKFPLTLSEWILSIFKAFVDACLKIGEVATLLEIKDNLPPAWLTSNAASFLLFDASNIGSVGDIEDPLNHEVFRIEQLEVVENLGRINYVQCAAYLGQHREKIIQASQSGIFPKALTERRITWLIYLIGALIGGQAPMRSLLNLSTPTARSFGAQSASDTESTMIEEANDLSGNETPETATRELSSKTFALMTNSVPSFDPNDVSEDSVETLELSMLYFMESFRKTQFGEQSRLLEAKFDSEDDVVTLILQKILYNLKTKTNYDTILSKSLSIFHSLSSSVLIVSSMPSQLLMSGRLLLRTSVIQSLLTADGSREIADALTGVKNGKHRTSFYLALTKLFLLSLLDEKADSVSCLQSDSGMGGNSVPQAPPKPADQATFNNYMQPLANVLTSLWPAGGPAGMTNGVSATDLAGDGRSPGQGLTILGLFRDLRGICQACITVESYNLFFNWLVNRPKNWEYSRLHLMTISLNAYWSEYPVAISILRFASELTSNKAWRIVFETTSPNGIILFREVSTILSCYAPQILAREPNSFGPDLYRGKYKGLALTLQIFSNALSGTFANLGAFQAYGDTALPSAIRLGINMCLAIPEDGRLPTLTKPHISAMLREISEAILCLSGSNHTEPHDACENKTICEQQATDMRTDWSST